MGGISSRTFEPRAPPEAFDTFAIAVIGRHRPLFTRIRTPASSDFEKEGGVAGEHPVRGYTCFLQPSDVTFLGQVKGMAESEPRAVVCFLRDGNHESRR